MSHIAAGPLGGAPVSTLIAIATGFVPGELKTFSLFIGGFLSAGIYLVLSRRVGVKQIAVLSPLEKTRI